MELAPKPQAGARGRQGRMGACHLLSVLVVMYLGFYTLLGNLLWSGFPFPDLTTFSDGCLGSNNDEGRSEV